MSLIVENVKHKQAGSNTIYHCLYGYFFMGLKQNYLAKIYGKDRTTISRWIKKYENDGNISRKKRAQVFLKFNEEKRKWLVALYTKKPILTLSEARLLFYQEFRQQISVSSISFILREAGMTWKRLERRAIQISMSDIARYTVEMNNIDWFLQSLVFADEVSFDNRGMLRKNGYGIKGKRLVYRGEFTRKARVSSLCFLGVNGIENCYVTTGTFDRTKFVYYLRRFILDYDSEVRTYPGRCSILVLDGAKIHIDANLVSYIRSLGLKVIYLPSYCPFFMPIEIVFGLMKRKLKQIYKENSKTPLKVSIGEVVKEFQHRDMRQIFKKCGYLANGTFDPAIALGNIDKVTGFNN